MDDTDYVIELAMSDSNNNNLPIATQIQRREVLELFGVLQRTKFGILKLEKV
jgi:hypothetical protein